MKGNIPVKYLILVIIGVLAAGLIMATTINLVEGSMMDALELSFN